MATPTKEKRWVLKKFFKRDEEKTVSVQVVKYLNEHKILPNECLIVHSQPLEQMFGDRNPANLESIEVLFFTDAD